MKRAIIIHGAYGNPNINWIPWLKEQLEMHHYHVIVPCFPTPEHQELESWMKVVLPYLNNLDSESLLIGHSIGATFVLHLLEQLDKPIAVAAMVAGFIEDLPDESLNLINHSFYDNGFDWEKIQSSAHHFLLYHSSDDPFVPMKNAQQLATLLNTPLSILNQAGHFNEASGFTAFPALLQDILSKTK